MSLIFINESPLTSAGWTPEESFENSAFLWGMSVFTTSLILDGQWGFSTSHLERLEKGKKWLFHEELNKDQMLDEIREHSQFAQRDLSTESLRLRVTLFENQKKQHVDRLYQFQSFEDPRKTSLSKSLTLKENPFIGQAKSDGVKLGSYGETYRLKSKSESDILFYDEKGFLLESTNANIVLKRKTDEQWVTPKKSSGVLLGIGLGKGLKDLSPTSDWIHKDELKEIDGAFLVNALRGIQPIGAIDGFSFSNGEKDFNNLSKMFWNNFFKDSLKL